MSKKRARLRRVMRRDEHYCGLHIGGCGKRIQKSDKRNLDHIIPRALFSVVAKDRISEFNEDWNLQPMHLSCNYSRGSYMEGWPRFNCKCHLLQIYDGDLYVCTKGQVREGRHIFLANVVSAEYDTSVSLITGSGTGKGGTKSVGFHKGRFGYLMPYIAPSKVELFNLTELSRVGLLAPKH